MEDILRKILSFEKVKEIYSNDLMTIKSISQHLGIWDSFSDEEKDFCNDLKTEEVIQLHKSLKKLSVDEKKSFIEKNWNQELKSYSYGYGEISKSGVDKLSNFIENNINQREVFYDVGSGNGKLCLHMSLISEFNKIKGVEIDEIRHLYGESIKKSIGGFDNVEFINESISNVNLSDASVVFMNDILFSENLISEIINKLEKGTHLISYNNQLYLEIFNNLTYVDSFNLFVSWVDLPVTFNHYII
jgi:SAM-dependent methyltransferase